jgi:DNA-binding LacI/PurR family transcriptional regulator
VDAITAHSTASPRAGAHPPKYVGLARSLLQRIATEKLKPGQRLGTEQELMFKHSVSRVTVRQALAMLEREGFISREKARGTFVRRAVEKVQPLKAVRGTAAVICSNEQAAHLEEDFGFAAVLRAVERTLSRNQFSVQMLGIGEDHRADRARLEQLLGRPDLDGICTIGPCLEPYRELCARVPVVCSCCFYASDLPLVGQDVSIVVRESTDYLIARGHRRIGLLCGPWVDQRAFAIFAAGYRKAFAAADLPVDRSMMFHAYTGEDVGAFAREVLGCPSRPTAVFADNWKTCEGVLLAARQLGLRIPADLSIIAYGQNVLQLSSPVGITTYLPDSNSIGEQAGQLLSAIISGEGAPAEPIGIPGTLMERDSVRAISPDDTSSGPGRRSPG